MSKNIDLGLFWFDAKYRDGRNLLLNKQSIRIDQYISLSISIIAFLIIVIVGSLYLFAIDSVYQSLANRIVFFALIPLFINKMVDNFEFGTDLLMSFVAILFFSMGHEYESSLLLSMLFLSESIAEFIKKKADTLFSNSESSSNYVRIVNGNEDLKLLEDILPGDALIIEEGGLIPIDSVLREGNASISKENISGESQIEEIYAGSKIPSGSINMGGDIIVISTSSYKESVYFKIQESLLDQHSKVGEMVYIEKYVNIYMWIILGIFFLSSLFFYFTESTTYIAAERSTSLLTIMSPCAILISIPIAYAATISSLFKKNILVKDKDAIHNSSIIENIFFDKTGTLTNNNMDSNKISKVEIKNVDIDLLSSLLFEIEKSTNHPVGRLLFNWSKTKKRIDICLKKTAPLAGTVNDKKFYIENLSNKGGEIHKTKVVIGDGCAIFHIKFHIRENANKLVKKLNDMGINSFMITGDGFQEAKRVANITGISIKNVFYSLSPDDKASIIERYKNTMMVGDGINDSIALSKASSGVIISNEHTDIITLFSSSILISDDNILSILKIIEASKKAKSIIYQNIIAATLIIVIGSILASIYVMPLGIAITIHEGGTILLALNSLRALF